MSERLKVLVLTSTFPRWQGDTCPMFVADLCEGLSEQMDVTVLAPGAEGAAGKEQWGRFTVKRFGYSWPARTQQLAIGAIMPNIRRRPILLAQVPPFFLMQLFSAWRLMRKERFDAIHAHWAVPQGIVAGILKRVFKVPVITTTHGGDIYALRGGAAMTVKRWALRSSDQVTAVSSSLRDEVVALGPEAERVSVLPMGVDTTRFRPDAGSPEIRRELNPSGGPTLLFVGRLVEKKGTRYAIEAMPAILAEHPDARFVIVGDGPEREMLEGLAADLGVGASVSFLGAFANERLPELYASADVFVGPSVVEANGDTESFGVVFAEAMSSGCVVVTTDVGGIADLVQGGETGMVVPPRDSVAISAAVLNVLADPVLRDGLRFRGLRAMRERFDHRRLHAEYARLIERAAA